MTKADGSQRRFPLPEGPTTVGRKNSCGLRIPLTSVSRLHCEFRVDGDRVSLRDLGSSNGTFKNGQRVQDTDLQAGDEVEVGPVRFTVVLDGHPAGTSESAAAGPVNDDTAAIDLSDAPPDSTDDPASHSGLPTTGILSGAGSVDLAAEDAEDVLDEDDELAAAMASMEQDDDEEEAADTFAMGGDPDDSSEFAFSLDDGDEDGDDGPVIELLDEDEEKT
ncbi:MAG: FHA domain-containing protein [Planctomycetota bacterium]